MAEALEGETYFSAASSGGQIQNPGGDLMPHGMTVSEWTTQRIKIDSWTDKHDGEHCFADVLNLRDEANALKAKLATVEAERDDIRNAIIATQPNPDALWDECLEALKRQASSSSEGRREERQRIAELEERALENATDCMESTKLADVISLGVTELDAAEARGRGTWAEEIRVMVATIEDKARTKAIKDCIVALTEQRVLAIAPTISAVACLKTLLADDAKGKESST